MAINGHPPTSKSMITVATLPPPFKMVPPRPSVTDHTKMVTVHPAQYFAATIALASSPSMQSLDLPKLKGHTAVNLPGYLEAYSSCKLSATTTTSLPDLLQSASTANPQ